MRSVSVSFLRDIEHGRANPSIGTLSCLADVLDVDVHVFLLAASSEKDREDILEKTRSEFGQTKGGGINEARIYRDL